MRTTRLWQTLALVIGNGNINHRSSTAIPNCTSLRALLALHGFNPRGICMHGLIGMNIGSDQGLHDGLRRIHKNWRAAQGQVEFLALCLENISSLSLCHSPSPRYSSLGLHVVILGARATDMALETALAEPSLQMHVFT